MLHVGAKSPSTARLWRREGCQSLPSHKTKAFLLCLITVGDSDANAEVSKRPVISRNALYSQTWSVLARWERVDLMQRPPRGSFC